MLLGGGCASHRLVALENQVLHDQVAEQHRRLLIMQDTVPNPEDFVRRPGLEDVHRFLERAGFRHAWSPDQGRITFDYAGRNTTFHVQLRVLDDVLFIGTGAWFGLHEVVGTEAMVSLLATVATANYELLLGKIQLDPSSGEIILSVEVPMRDGLGYDTLVFAVERLCQSADARHPDLVRAAAGRGL